MEKSWRIIDIINWGSEYFNSKNISDPRLHIELILSHVLKYERMKLYLDYEKPLNSIELTNVKDLIKRKIKREPIQYIVGETQFLSHIIKVNENVLIPRPETEFLIELIFKKFEKNENLKILDIGTGSGCISIALGNHFINSEILSIDISSNAVEIAKENAKLNNVNNIDFKIQDILKESLNSTFDIIVSNPPYISEKEYLVCEPEVQYFEPKNALSDFGDGLNFYRRFSNIFDDVLNDNGLFFLEIGYNQKKDIEKIFQSSYKIDIYDDFSNHPRYVIGTKIKKN